MAGKKALLAGSSGLIGRHCLDYLLASDIYDEVIALSRRPLNVKHKKFVELQIDFDRMDKSKQLIKADDIFCCLGTTIKKAGSQAAFSKVDLEYPRQLAELGVANGVKRYFLITSIGADARSSNFYLKVKGEVEAAIARLPFEAVHIFRPSLLLGERDEVRAGERFGAAAAGVLSFVFHGPLKKYRPIEAKVVAFAMVELARECAAKGTIVHQSDEIQAIYDRRM